MSGVRFSHLSAFGMATKPFGKLRINSRCGLEGGKYNDRVNKKIDELNIIIEKNPVKI
jgi:hypothetical protein